MDECVEVGIWCSKKRAKIQDYIPDLCYYIFYEFSPIRRCVCVCVLCVLKLHRFFRFFIQYVKPPMDFIWIYIILSKPSNVCLMTQTDRFNDFRIDKRNLMWFDLHVSLAWIFLTMQKNHRDRIHRKKMPSLQVTLNVSPNFNQMLSITSVKSLKKEMKM